MPKLQTLIARNFIPDCLFSQALTSLKITFDDRNDGDQVGGGIIKFLPHVAPSLRHFFIKFHPDHFYAEDMPPSDVTVVLPQLQTLEISGFKSLAGGLLKALIAPQLKTLSLALELLYGETLEQTWVDSVITPASIFAPHLRDFSFTINTRPRESDEVQFHLAPFFAKFNHVQNVSVQSPKDVVMVVDDWQDTPNLKRLKLDCAFFDLEDFKDHVLHGLRAQPGFELLTIELRRIDKELISEVYECFPKDKLSFELSR